MHLELLLPNPLVILMRGLIQLGLDRIWDRSPFFIRDFRQGGDVIIPKLVGTCRHWIVNFHAVVMVHTIKPLVSGLVISIFDFVFNLIDVIICHHVGQPFIFRPQNIMRISFTSKRTQDS